MDTIITIDGVTSMTFNVKGKGYLCPPLDCIEAFLIPSFPTNIISFDSVRQQNISIVYYNNFDLSNDTITLFKNRFSPIATFYKQPNGLFLLQSKHQAYLTIIQKLQLDGLEKDSIKLMHRVHQLHTLTAYTDLDRLATAIRNNAIIGIPKFGNITARDVENYKRHMHMQVCNGCRFGKSSSAPAAPLDNIDTCHDIGTAYADVMHINLKKNRLNFFLAIDGYSKMTFVSRMEKLDIDSFSTALLDLKDRYTHHKHKLACVHVDNAKGIRANDVRRLATREEIMLHFHSPGRHVRKAEITIKTVKRAFKATILGLSYPCPHRLYEYAIIWVVQTLNLTLRHSNDFLSPSDKFASLKPNFEKHFTVKFGDLITFRKHADDNKRVYENKSKVTLGIILYRHDNNGHHVLNLDTKVITVRHAFTMVPLPYCDTTLNAIAKLGEATCNTALGHIDEPWFQEIIDEENSDSQSQNESPKSSPEAPICEPAITNNAHNIEDHEQAAYYDDISDSDEDDLDSTTSSDIESILSDEFNENDDYTDQPGEATAAEPDTMEDNDDDSEYVETPEQLSSIEANHSEENDEQSYMQSTSTLEPYDEPLPQLNQPRRSPRAFSPNPRIFGYSKRNFVHLATDNMTVKQSNATMGTDATANAIWKELSQLIEAGVWTMVKKNESKAKRKLPSHLILKAKKDANNIFTKLKARLVALGNRDPNPPNAAASPTASITTILTALTIAAKRRWKISTADVTGAYLHADLDREVFMTINKDMTNIMATHMPCSEYINEDGTITVKLNKCLYGLRESGRQWYLLLSKILKTAGLKQSSYDPCLFYNNSTIVCIYVDDILLISKTEKQRDYIQEALRKAFTAITINNNENDLDFLGIKISKRGDDIILSQKGYIDKITKSKTLTHRSLPHTTRFKATDTSNNKEKVLKNNYLSALMRQMYLATRTRPDILVNTSILASRSEPSSNDLQDLNTLLSYLKSTEEDCLHIRHEGEISISVYCDASHASHADRKSHSGYAIFLDKNSGAVLSKSKKQRLTSASSTEAEIIAMYDATIQAIWIRNLLNEIGIPSPPIQINEDNKSAIIISSTDPTTNNYSKFVDIKYRILNEYKAKGEIEINYIPSAEQIADLLTKPINNLETFNKFKDRLLGR